MKKIKSILAGLMAAGMMAACGPFVDNPIDNIISIEEINVIANQLKADGTATILVGEEMQLTITLTPADAELTSVAFTSTDELIATVSEDGLVQALAPGTVNIYVTINDDPELTSVITLTVVGSQVEINGGNKVDQAEAEARKK